MIADYQTSISETLDDKPVQILLQDYIPIAKSPKIRLVGRDQ